VEEEEEEELQHCVEAVRQMPLSDSETRNMNFCQM
jgi:hypothetical protein